ncbi:MAG: hypothetical protein DI549_15475 [Ancylobacter novellus]|uniref:EamA domain-containing protein n=1 Tax=Ancylobacter novellus TaxID=921 RepID=A0A2W5T260_ANCNO|nr:MAG: hypothetical protein DI549_15475 [Ancylobacter novellus]
MLGTRGPRALTGRSRHVGTFRRCAAVVGQFLRRSCRGPCDAASDTFCCALAAGAASPAALHGILNIAVFTVLIYAGLARTSLVNGSIIGSAAPIVVGLFGWLILAERTSLRARFALAVSTAGVALIVLRGDVRNLIALDLNSGDLMLFLGISAFALYAVLLKRFPTRLSAAAALAVSIPFGLIALAPFALWEIANSGIPNDQLGKAAWIVVYVASLPTLGFVLWARGVSLIGPTRAGQFLQLVPVFGSALAVGLLGEVLHLHHALGFALVLGGIALCDRRTPQRLPD